MSTTWKRFNDWVNAPAGAKFMAVWMAAVTVAGIYLDAGFLWTAINAALAVHWTIDAIRG